MAVPSAGTFTASALQTILARADERWVESIQTGDYEAHTESLDAVLATQRPGMFRELETEKDNVVKLAWLNNCNTSTASCSNDCTIGGDELSSDAKEYELDLCRTAGFSVKEKQNRTDLFSMSDKISHGILTTQALLDNWLNEQVLAFLAANSGTSTYFAKDWAQESGGTDIEVPSSDFDSGRVIPKLLLTAKRNNFAMPFTLSGELLWLPSWEAMINEGNADGKGDAAKFRQLERFYDLWDFDAANDPDEKLYLINKGSVAFVSKAYYGDTPTDYFSQRRWSRPSFNLPSIRYDWVYTNACSSNEITHHFSCYVKAGLFLNPTGCTETKTGILGVKKIASI